MSSRLFGRVRPGGFHIEVEADRRFEFLDEHGTSRGTLEVEIVASEITVRGRSPAFSDDVLRPGRLNVGYGSEAAAGKARREPPLSALVPMTAPGASR